MAWTWREAGKSIGVIMAVWTINTSLGATLVKAKNIDYTPAITSDSYWNSHRIALVAVVGVGVEGGRERISYRVVTSFTGDNGRPQEGSVWMTDLWFGIYVKAAPEIAAGERLVFYWAADGSMPIVADTGDAVEQSARSLARISALRRVATDTPALADGAFDRDPAVAQYALKRLLDDPTASVPVNLLTRLRTLRGQADAKPDVRLLANSLANRLEGKPRNSDEEYAWLTASLSGSTAGDWTELRAFVERLLDFDRRRPATIEFLTRLVLDGSKREDIRIASYGAFEDPRLFHFAEPDTESNRVFQACINMLADPNPLIRRAGAVLLNNDVTQIAPATRKAYAGRAAAALQSAIEKEGDEQNRVVLKSYLDLIAKQQ